MPECPIRRALIAVYDKTGVAEFARALVDEFGIEIISTGGTAKHLKAAGVPVTLVEEVTGFPEMLDGRVKTLHPKIHAAILADRDNPEHMRQLAEQGIKPIDMVVVNLYPFEKTVADPNCKFEDAIEMIDIGGPCLLRAAAKNHKHVYCCCYTWKYQDDLDLLSSWNDERLRTARYIDAAYDAFWLTNTYDLDVAEWLSKRVSSEQHNVEVLRLCSGTPLRYGENPHQNASIYQLYGEQNQTSARLVVNVSRTSKKTSFNNYLDAHAAQSLTDDLTKSEKDQTSRSCCVFVKHNNACGVGIDDEPIEAYRKAYLGDPNAAMGGVLAVNFQVDTEFASVVMETFSRWGKTAGAGGFFLEVWLAPDFTDDYVVIQTIQNTKAWGKNVRLLDTGFENEDGFNPRTRDYRTINGAILVQDHDLIGLNEDQWKVVSKRAPTESEISDLRLAWLVAKHTKSNAISICKDGMLIGNGAGQMSRVMSCRLATWLAKENGHADQLAGSAAASDAFFPFRDGPDLLLDAGVTAIIQPGGSKHDDDTIKACDERGATLVFTGTRHFKH